MNNELLGKAVKFKNKICIVWQVFETNIVLKLPNNKCILVSPNEIEILK